MPYNNQQKQQQQHRQISIGLDTFWSSDTFSQGSGDYQNIKLGLYGPKVSMNFSKGSSATGKSQSAYLSMDYESAVAVYNTLDFIRRMRRKALAEGVELPLWSFKNSIQFTEKGTKELRTIGTFEIRTAISEVSGKNTVYIIYNTGTDEWKIALGSTYLKDQMSFETNTDFVIDDTRFDAFVYQFSGLIMNYPVMAGLTHITGIIMNNFSAVRNKLGCAPKSFGNGPKFTDKNYHHNGGSGSNELPPPPPPDNGSDDIPF